MGTDGKLYIRFKDSTTGSIRIDGHFGDGSAFIIGKLIFSDDSEIDLNAGLPLEGGSGHDTLYGSLKDDVIKGGDGSDQIVGLSGNDIIEGGTGNDTLHGNEGNDIFVIEKENSATDTIVDFNATNDMERIDVSGIGVESISELDLEQIGNDVILNLGSANKYVLKNVNITDLDFKDFIFSPSIKTPPVANDDFVNTDQDVPIIIDVLANDFDLEDATIDSDSIILGNAVSGILFKNNDGTVTYTPNSNFFGNDSFSYTITDSDGNISNVAKVDVTVKELIKDFAIEQIQTPIDFRTSSTISVSYDVRNTGDLILTDDLNVSLYLSNDTSLGSDDTLLSARVIDISSGLALDATQSALFSVPSAVLQGVPYGDYHFIIDASLGGALPGNVSVQHTEVSGTIKVEPLYKATINAPTGLFIAGEDTVELTGKSLSTIDNSPIAFEEVSIDIVREDFIESYSVVTDAQGSYSFSYKPLDTAGGAYFVNAYHPYFKDEDTVYESGFNVIDIDIQQQEIFQEINTGQQTFGTLSIVNQSNQSLTGLSFDLSDVPQEVQVSFSNLPIVINPGETVFVDYSLESSVGNIYNEFNLKLNSTEGASDTVDFNVNVTDIPASLVLDTSNLERGLTRGEQTFVEFVVFNAGQEAAESVLVQLPPLPWMTLVGDSDLGSIVGGETKVVTMLLEPPTDSALGQYAGDIFVTGENSNGDALNITADFGWNVTSDQIGGFELQLTDEYTYFVDGSPKVNDAIVRIIDSSTGEQVARYDDVDEMLSIDNLNEGSYTLHISSDNHTSFQGNINIQAGSTLKLEAFLPRETVKYHWSVEEIEIEDRTRITLETEFETDVPIPVVVMDPPILDFSDLEPGETKVIDMIVTNHGFISVQDFMLSLPDPKGFDIDAAITSLDKLAAKSSVSIPITITRFPDPDQISSNSGDPLGGLPFEIPSPEATDDCSTSGHITYEYICGPNNVWRKEPVGYELDQDCDIPSFPSGGVYNGLSSGHSGFSSGLPSGYGLGGDSVGSGAGPSTPTFYYTPTPKESNTKNPCSDDIPNIPGGDCLPELFELGINLGIALLPFFLPGIGAPLALAADKLDDYFDGKEPTPVQEILGASMTHALGGLGASSGLLKGVGFARRIPELVEDVKYLIICLNKQSASSESQTSLLNKSLLISNLLNDETFLPESASIPIPKFSTGSNDVGTTALDMNVNELSEFLENDRFDGILRLDEFLTRAQDYSNYTTYILGDARWYDVTDTAGLQLMLDFVIDKINTLSTIIIDELPVPSDAPDDLVTSFAERYNRTIDYYQQDIMTTDQLQLGDNPDFIALDTLALLTERLVGPLDATDEVRNLISEYDEELLLDVQQALVEYEIEQNKVIEGVCASIKLRIEQDVVMSRTAFLGSLDIEAGAHVLDSLDLDIIIYDSLGNVVDSNIFGISNTYLQGISALDGTDDLNANMSLHAEYTMLPSTFAAQYGATGYSIGGQITFIEEGQTVTQSIVPVEIDVLPQAELVINYFQERNVYGDDPFTDEIEPSSPFTLGVQVTNQGLGDANNLYIESAQPEIIENDKGLLTSFKILSTKVDGNETNNGLTAYFGTVDAGDTKTGLWSLEAQLQGKFISYNASFEHINSLGITESSIIKEVNIHELLHDGDVDGDDKTDFFTNEIPDLNDTPDTIFFGDGTQSSVSNIDASFSEFQTLDSGAFATAKVTPNSKNSDWDYFSTFNLATDSYIIESISREDGSILSSENYWQTDRTFTNAAVKPVYEDKIHILDNQQTGYYNISFKLNEININTDPVAIDVSSSINEGIEFIISPADLLIQSNASDIDGDILTVGSLQNPVNGTVAFDPNNGDVIFTPNPNYNGSASFEFTIIDGNGGEVTQAVNLNIISINDKPIVSLINETTAEDTDIIISLPNASDIEDISIVATSANVNIYNATPGASVILNPDGTISYSPVANFSGVDTFEYTITDSQGLESNPQFVEVHISPINDTPLASDDLGILTNEDEPIQISATTLLVNDTDIDGDVLSITSVDSQATDGNNNVVGLVSLTGSDITFTPNLNYSGLAFFNYTISDGSLTDSGMVSIKVDPVADVPVISILNTSGYEDLPIDLNLSIDPNDTDGSEVIGNIIISGVPSDASLSAGVLQTNGDWNLLANDLVGLQFIPAPDFNGDINLQVSADSVEIANNDIANTNETITVTVRKVNDAPIAIDDSVIVNENSSIIIDVLANDTDPDGDLLSIESVDQPSYGQVRIENGKLVYEANNGYVGDDSFTYRINDGNGSTSSAMVSLVVQSAPVAKDDNAILLKNNSITFNIISNDSDVEDGLIDPYSISWEQPEHGSIINNYDGTITYTPDQDYAGNDNFKYTVTDSEGAVSNEANVNLVVANMIGSEGRDILRGSNESDIIFGLEGNDALSGLDGNDILAGGLGADILSGGRGNDILFGGEGNDLIYSDNGADILFGGEGVDTLSGGNGNDIIKGGLSSDILFGGYGADIFVFDSLNDSNSLLGVDTIVDFRSGRDKIDFMGLVDEGVTSFNDISILNNGFSTKISSNSAPDFEINLIGYHNLDENDFVF